MKLVMSVGPPARQHGTTRLPLDALRLDFIFEYFRKSVEKIQVLLKSDKNITLFMCRPFYFYDKISLNSSQNEKCFRQNL